MTAAAPVQRDRHDPYAALRLPSYRWYIVSLLAMTAGTQVQAVVVAWQIYALTHDPLSLGLVGLAEALPYISLALLAGHFADRRDRRRIAVGALGVLGLCSVAYFLLTHAPGAIGPHRVWPMYVVVFAGGVARSFLQPARTALGAELVPRELYTNSIAWRSSVWQFAAVAGPALGGLLYGFCGPLVSYAVAGALVFVSLLCMLAVEYVARPVTGLAEPIRRSLATGIAFVRHQPVVLAAMTLDLFSVLFGGAEALAPVFADSILHVGPKGLGVIRAAPAAGAVVMSIWLAHRPPMQRAGRDLFLAVAAFGACMIGFGLSRSFYLSVVLLALSGMADNVSVVIRSTLVQTLTPEALLGRVSAVNNIFIGSSNEIGAFESGLTAKLIGAVGSVVIGGSITLGVVAATAWRVPQLRRLRRIEAPAT